MEEKDQLGPLFRASDHENDGKKHVLLAASGSVATIKLPNITAALSARGDVAIRIILTASARKFLLGQSAEQPTLQSLREMQHVQGIYVDEDEWRVPWTRGQHILHIELRRWAHVMLVAPLSANTLAKMIGGLCDNLLLSVVRAWEVERRPGPPPRIFVAPAMNTAMWRHPITGKQVAMLGDEREGFGRWMSVVGPMQKALACGDVGDGAMEDWKKIVGVVEEYLEERYGQM
ncbi:hypothetical protein KEM55_005263, partial [Ascosphaera atra]